MNLWKRLVKLRRSLSITTKFTWAFIALVLLICVVALTGFVSLKAVREETQYAIDTGVRMQRLVFEMDAALRNARRLERDFFLLWPTIGFSQANQDYAQEHEQTIADLLDISSRLQDRLARPNVSQVLRQSTKDLQDYRLRVERYTENFRVAVSLVKDLGIEDVGVLAKLEQHSTQLKDSFQLVDAPELMVSYLEMQSLEREYLLTRQDSTMKSVSEAAQALRKGILSSSKLNAVDRDRSLKALEAYESVTQEIAKLNEQILNKIRNNVDVDTAVVSEKLLGVAKSEVERAGVAIDWKIQWAKSLLILAMIVALLVAAAVAKQFASALKALAEEQKKSERLLLNILPGPIAHELKREERTIADSFTEVSVMFADIVGFTELAAQTDPIELVEILNVIFSEFDQLTEAHGLEKIKTIGDAYMVVGGLPAPKPNHAEAIAAMALDMQAAIAEYSRDTGQNLSIRIGINTGPVIAGIIGTKKFIYDLWGDTVNIASRMESHGIPGSIQVTEATYLRLKSQFLFEERGQVKVKGRGMMNCYLLQGKKG
ncbi:MAG TPA: adenylate/guanylate cyclase domain-containing protein [Coleofasciculaceae cyanobacterium]